MNCEEQLSIFHSFKDCLAVSSAETIGNVIKRRDSFNTLSTVIEAVEEEDQSETNSEAPQSLFSHTESTEILPEAPTDVPPLLIPEKNPKLDQLVQMGSDSSFWWDSTDSSGGGGLVQNFASFDSSISGAVVDGKQSYKACTCL